MLLAVGAVAHHNHGVFNIFEETAQHIDDGRCNAEVNGMRIRALALNAE